jgi:hypothetical protein
MWMLNSEMINASSSMQLCNGTDFFVPFSRTDTCQRFPVYELSHLWNEFKDYNIRQY